jgi:hypothetical protein
MASIARSPCDEAAIRAGFKFIIFSARIGEQTPQMRIPGR